ncbi:glycerate kinase [Caenimonas terrae]|uniref:Glycerate kinase n=1 Tax=Caenimonas terrae TaxID=696074 RepID=A0ABW0N717_9BURK
MKYQKILVPVIGIALLAGAWHTWGWPGVALVTGGLVMWVLLYVNRLMTALKRAADRPIGYVDSAVMLHTRLKRGLGLLKVIAMTRSLGTALSPEGEQPEFYRWTDASESHVTCEFVDGKLVKWELVRPEQAEPADASDSPAAATGS